MHRVGRSTHSTTGIVYMLISPSGGITLQSWQVRMNHTQVRLTRVDPSNAYTCGMG